jgi:hypothetical protein
LRRARCVTNSGRLDKVPGVARPGPLVCAEIRALLVRFCLFVVRLGWVFVQVVSSRGR